MAALHKLMEEPRSCHIGGIRVCAQLLSRVQLFATPRTVAHQAQTLSMGFPRQEHWSGLPFPSPRDLADQGTEPMSPAPLVGVFFTTEPSGKSNKNS